MQLPVISLQRDQAGHPAGKHGTCGGHGHVGGLKDAARQEPRPPGNARLGGSLALPVRHWKSLEQRENSPKFQRRAANEFPPNALDEPGDVSRRTLLKMMSAAVAVAAAGGAGCERKVPETIVPYVRQPEGLVPGQPKYYATAMTLQGYAQGVLATSREGRPVKLEGNPDHPANHGSSDVFLQASLLDLYDPERSQSVTKVGNVSDWDTFIGALRSHLAKASAGGPRLALLTERLTSPTILEQIRKLKGKYQNARWFVHDPLSRENVREGLRRATGREVDARYDFGKASVIASFDCDFLFEEPGHLRYAGDFVSGRRIRRETKTMNRLYVVESSVSITGTMADHRRAVRPSDVARHVHDLARAVTNPSGATEDWVRALAQDLVANKGRGLVVAGACHAPDVHAAVHSINQTLGNIDQTVHYAPSITGQPDGSLRDLLDQMRSGGIDTLFILGGNPAYNAPVDYYFADALEAFSKPADRNFTARLGHYADETSFRCQWHLPQSHYLEEWCDARAYDGTVSLVQPLIDPLYATRSTVEVLDILDAGCFRSGYEILRQFWHGRHNGGDFEPVWRRSLEKGVWLGKFEEDAGSQTQSTGGSATAASQPTPTTQSAPATEPSGFDVVFKADPNVWDGTFANNAFLQELMKPLTKLTWDNAALLSPATAKSLGVGDGDMLRIAASGREIDLPALVTPGHPDRTLTLHLGYGRTHGGSVARGLGFNTYVLRTSENPWFVSGAQVQKIEGHHPLVVTRDHQTIPDRRVGGLDARVTQRPGDESIDNRRLVRVATLEQFLENPEFVKELEKSEVPEPLNLYPGYDKLYEQNLAWGMSIDIQSCIGCNACIIGCQTENNIPVVGKEEVARGREMHWIRVDTYYEGNPESPGGTYHQPVPCMHCETAPCELVCPVGATVHDNEGINDMVYNRCVGTRYCSNNCPYKVRRFNFFHYNDTQTESLKLMRNPEVTVRSRGVMEKCTYCIQRIVATRREMEILQVQMDDEARAAGSPEEAQSIRKKSAQQRQKALDGLQTACQQACPTQAIVFGNINPKTDPIHEVEPDHLSQVAKLKQEPLDYSLLAELNTKPRTTYLARIQNPNPALPVEAPTA